MLLDDVFSREFARTLSVLPTDRSIFNLPVPNFDESFVHTHVLRGITDEYYSKLNDAKVSLIKKSGRDFKRRLLGSDGKFRKDADGNMRTEKVDIPAGSVVVVSPIKLGLPWGYKPSQDGFGYIDLTKGKDGVIYYFYIIPKEFVYPVKKVALVVSSKKLVGYHGFSFRTWNYGKVQVWVIPYDKNKKYQNTKIVKVGDTIDFNKEISQLYDFWVFRGIISPSSDYVRGDGVSVAYEELSPALDSFDFNSYSEESLAYRESVGGENFDI